MVNKNIKSCVALILAMFMGMGSFFIVRSLSTLTLQIDKITDDKYPSLEVYISVSDERNASVRNLDKNNFSLTEAGTPVSAFEVSPIYEKSLAVVLAIDTSESMGFGKPVSALAASVAQAKKLVSALNSDDQVAIVTFSDKFSVAQALTSDKNQTLSALDSLRVTEKSASLYNAIAESALLLENFSGRRTVILFTDSSDAGYGGYSLDAALNIAGQKQVAFFPVFWNATSKPEMTKLASLTNGKEFSLGANQPGEQDFQAASNEIQNQLNVLREQYLLRFISTLPATGNEHDLVVKVDYQGAHAEDERKLTARAGTVTVNLKNLTEGQPVAGKVEIIPEVNAPGAVSKLEVFMDDKLVDTVSGEPFKYVWDASQTPVGNHSLKVVITDSVGNTGSKVLNVKVGVPLIVKILSPAAEAVIAQPISIEIEVISAKPVSYLEISLDKQAPQKIEAPASYPVKYPFDPQTVSAGKHQITVKAYDQDGFSGDATINLSVAPGNGNGALVAILVILALGGILIPIGLRSRRNRQGGSDSVIPVAGSAWQAESTHQTAALKEISGTNPGQVWPLNQDEIRLGRKSTENDIPLLGAGASRYHAVIRRNGGQFVLFVLNPANSVVVNQLAVTSQKVLEPGDVLQAGESTFRFEA